MKSVPALAALAMATLLAGCAAPDDTATQNAKPEKYYRTGSNIPVKDAPPPAMTQEEKDRAAESMRRASVPKPSTN
jgi:hypothetical protein